VLRDFRPERIAEETVELYEKLMAAKGIRFHQAKVTHV